MVSAQALQLGHRPTLLSSESAGRPVALASLGEALELPFVHAGQPILALRGRWADPRFAGNMGVTQGVHVAGGRLSRKMEQ
jgi:hypothetical protein